MTNKYTYQRLSCPSPSNTVTEPFIKPGPDTGLQSDYLVKTMSMTLCVVCGPVSIFSVELQLDGETFSCPKCLQNW